MYCAFSSYSTNNFALKGKRKTLSASDVFSALEDMEFEQFIPELKECLEGAHFFVCLNRWISWCILPWELEGITSPFYLLIGQYPNHMTPCPPVAITVLCMPV